MPVRPEELLRATPKTIGEDRPCRFCGYNLRGLSDAGKCPECGKPIKKRELPRFTDQMIHAPLNWLRGYRLGTLLLFTGGWIMGLGLPAWALVFHPACGVAAMTGAAVWTIGAMLATRPRPRTNATAIDPDTEWSILRLWARCSQPLWIVGIGGVLAAQISGSTSPVTLALVALLLLVAVVGWWPLMMIQSHLAYWASDDDLAERLRHVAWGAGPSLGVGVGVLAVIGLGWSGGRIGSVLFFSVWAGTLFITLGFILLALWQLFRMAHWVMLGHINNHMRDERLRERARNAMRPQE